MHPGLADRICFCGDRCRFGTVRAGSRYARRSWPLRSCIRQVGAFAIRVAMQILNGEDVSRQYLLSSALIDKNNAGTLFIQSEQVVDHQHQIELQTGEFESMLSKYTFLQNPSALSFADGDVAFVRLVRGPCEPGGEAEEPQS